MAKLKHFGGTPVSEGVRLEVGRYTVFAVRNEEKDIAVRMRREPRRLIRDLMRIPLLRGIIRVFRDVIRFFDGIGESAELQPQHPFRGSRAERAAADFLHVRQQTLAAWESGILILLIAFACFWAAPQGAVMLIENIFDLPRVWSNVIACAFRITFFLTGIWACGQLRVINRLRMYRYALNQAINCYECRDEVTLENAQQYPRYARRSEPAYLISVMIVSMILFACLQPANILLTAVERIGIFIGISAFLNEFIHALENARMSPVIEIVRAPLDFFQLMTTVEPALPILEVAVCAVQTALGQGSREEESDDHRQLAEDSEGEA